MRKKVAIVGGGPSSWFARMACFHAGIVPTVFVRSEVNPPGAFWIHELPDFAHHLPMFKISVRSSGSREIYKRKQWGNIDLPENYRSSFPDLEYETYGADPSTVRSFVDSELAHERIILEGNLNDEDLSSLKDTYDEVFYTFPSERSKRENSEFFRFIPIFSTQTPVADRHIKEIFYDGRSQSSVVRFSEIWGMQFREYQVIRYPSQVDKFAKSNCVFIPDIIPTDRKLSPLSPEGTTPIGRLACMNRTMLSHQTYEIVREKLS